MELVQGEVEVSCWI